MRMGLPQVIISDQGSEFSNRLDSSLAELVGIKRKLTTPYHPQVHCDTAGPMQGIVELRSACMCIK